MKRTFTYSSDNILHLVESNEPVTICGLDVMMLEERKSFYNQDAFTEAVATYNREQLCPKCFPDTAVFETQAEIISEEEAETIIKSARGVKI